MPIFEYRCQGCEVAHEVIVLQGEAPPDACPDCGGELRRLWSRIGVQLTGWGFSRNDALVPERPGRQDFRKVRDKASELFD